MRTSDRGHAVYTTMAILKLDNIHFADFHGLLFEACFQKRIDSSFPKYLERYSVQVLGILLITARLQVGEVRHQRPPSST